GFCSPAPSQGPEGQAWGLVVRCRLLKSTSQRPARARAPHQRVPGRPAAAPKPALPPAPNRAEPRPAGGPARVCVGRKAAEAAPPSRTRGEPGRRKVRARMLRAGQGGRACGRCRA
ncbi:putative Methyltransferase Tarbp1, partial [Manis pentadactyla]